MGWDVCFILVVNLFLYYICFFIFLPTTKCSTVRLREGIWCLFCMFVCLFFLGGLFCLFVFVLFCFLFCFCFVLFWFFFCFVLFCFVLFFSHHPSQAQA